METEKTPELLEYVHTLRRRRRLIAAVWVPFVLVSMLLAVGLPSEYGSTATFQLRTEINDRTRGDNYADRYVSGLAGTVLGSPELRAALATLTPYPRLAQDPAAALKKLQGDVRVEMLTQKILDPLNGLERKINTGFTVTYFNGDAEVAQKVAAWLANAFVIGSRQAAAEEVLKESSFYAAEADRQRAKIAASEARLAQFKQQNFDQLPDTAQANLGVRNLTEQDLEGADRELRVQQQNRTFILQQLQQARAAGANADRLRTLEEEYQKKASVYDPSHPDMIALRSQIEAMRRGDVAAGAGTDLEAQLAAQRATLTELRQRYSEDHPDVKRLERSIANLQARIAAGEHVDAANVSRNAAVVQLETQLNGVEAQIASLERQRAELRAKQASLQTRLRSTPEVERAFDTLNRDAGTARQVYDQLINKKNDADIRVAAIKIGTADQFTLVSPPLIPNAPTKPARIGIAVIGLIGGWLLALMAALGTTMLDPTVRGSRDVVALLNITPIAIVPVIRNAAFVRRQRRRVAALATVTVVAVPALYLLIRFAAP